MAELAERSDQGTVFGHKLPRIYTDKIVVSGDVNVNKKLEIKIKFSIRDRADDFDDYILFDNDLLLDSILLDFFVSFDGLASEDIIAGKTSLWSYVENPIYRFGAPSPHGGLGGLGTGGALPSGMGGFTPTIGASGEASESLGGAPRVPTAMTMPSFDPLRAGGSVGFGTIFPADNPFLMAPPALRDTDLYDDGETEDEGAHPSSTGREIGEAATSGHPGADLESSEMAPLSTDLRGRLGISGVGGGGAAMPSGPGGQPISPEVPDPGAIHMVPIDPEGAGHIPIMLRKTISLGQLFRDSGLTTETMETVVRSDEESHRKEKVFVSEITFTTNDVEAERVGIFPDYLYVFCQSRLDTSSENEFFHIENLTDIIDLKEHFHGDITYDSVIKSGVIEATQALWLDHNGKIWFGDVLRNRLGKTVKADIINNEDIVQDLNDNVYNLYSGEELDATSKLYLSLISGVAGGDVTDPKLFVNLFKLTAMMQVRASSLKPGRIYEAFVNVLRKYDHALATATPLRKRLVTNTKIYDERTRLGQGVWVMPPRPELKHIISPIFLGAQVPYNEEDAVTGTYGRLENGDPITADTLSEAYSGAQIDITKDWLYHRSVTSEVIVNAENLIYYVVDDMYLKRLPKLIKLFGLAYIRSKVYIERLKVERFGFPPAMGMAIGAGGLMPDGIKGGFFESGAVAGQIGKVASGPVHETDSSAGEAEGDGLKTFDPYPVLETIIYKDGIGDIISSAPTAEDPIGPGWRGGILSAGVAMQASGNGNGNGMQMMEPSMSTLLSPEVTYPTTDDSQPVSSDTVHVGIGIGGLIGETAPVRHAMFDLHANSAPVGIAGTNLFFEATHMNLPYHEDPAQKHILLHVDEPVVGMFGTANLLEPPAMPIIGYKYTLEVRNKIGFVFSDFYYEHILSALVKLSVYKDFASGHCAANNLTDRFNDWFAEQAYQGFPQLGISGEVEAEFPWVIAPTVFVLTQELLDNAYDGSDALMKAEIKRIADTIEPRNGTLTNVENFLDDFNDLASRYHDEFKGEEFPFLPGVYDFNTGSGAEGNLDIIEKEFGRTIDLSVEYDAFEAMYQRGLDTQMQELWKIHQEALRERAAYEDAQSENERIADEAAEEAARPDCNCKIPLCGQDFCARFPITCQILREGVSIFGNGGGGASDMFGSSGVSGNPFTNPQGAVSSAMGGTYREDNIQDYFTQSVSYEKWMEKCPESRNGVTAAGIGAATTVRLTQQCSNFLERRFNDDVSDTDMYNWMSNCKQRAQACRDKLESADCSHVSADFPEDDGYGWNDALQDAVEGSKKGGALGALAAVIGGALKKK